MVEPPGSLLQMTTSKTPYHAHTDEGESSSKEKERGSDYDKQGSTRSSRSRSGSRERRNKLVSSEQRLKNASERSSGGFANALDNFHNSSSSTTNIIPDPERDTDAIHKPYAQHHLLQDSGSIFGQGGCRDVIFALLFYAHVGALIYCAILYAPEMIADMANNSESSTYYNSDSSSSSSSSSSNNGDGGRSRRLVSSSLLVRFLDQEGQAADAGDDAGDDNSNNSNSNNYYNSYNADDDIDIDPQALLLILCLASVLGFVLSSFGLALMMSCATLLIKLALWFNILLLAGLAVFAIVWFGTAGAAIPVAILFFILAGFAAAYAYHVWSRIPFAASNLVTAVSAVRSNMGLAFYAYWSVGVLFAWSILWFIATSSTLYVLADCHAATGACNDNINGLLLFAFILSFYWTAQVISNVVHVTTAGTVGTWWFHPREARGCCSKAVRQSYIRALTTSFGSICLGSLIVAIVQALKETVQRAQDQDSVLACIVVCLMGCLESLIEYFNKWAYVYVGLYGVSFMEAGSNVMQLFRARGWTAIIADLMVDTVLCMLSVGVGLLTAVVAVIICMSSVMGVVDTTTLAMSFGIGFGVGHATCATLFSIVSSAVNTVIVLYAEAPNEFQQNYPDLAMQMRDSWRQAWPNEFAY